MASWLNAPKAQPLSSQGGDDFGNSTFLRPSDSNYNRLSSSIAQSSSSSSSGMSQQNSFVNQPQQSFSSQTQPQPLQQSKSFFSKSQSQPIQESQQQQVPLQPQAPQPKGKKVLKAVLYFFDLFFCCLGMISLFFVLRVIFTF